MSSITQFEPAPERLSIRKGEVHLWRTTIHSVPLEIARWLSPHEQSRAARFHFEKDRIAFVASRGVRRTILSRYVGVDPANLQFAEGKHGKPQLSAQATDIRFNVSHAGNLLLVAISHTLEVGVDVEMIRDNITFNEVAGLFFSPAKAAMVRSAPDQSRAKMFFELWTQMEARLKAIGIGLGSPIEDPRAWTIQQVYPAEGYIAALAVEDGPFELSCWSLDRF